MKTPFAVISDIHANLAAFKAVLEVIRAQGIEEIVCLGDIVGYGAEPRECLALAHKTCSRILLGNHDLGVIRKPMGFNPRAYQALLWTRREVRRGWLFSGKTRKMLRRLREAEPYFEDGEFFFVHGSPRDPLNEYVEEADTRGCEYSANPKMEDIFARFRHFCFVGHTHVPGVITDDFCFFPPADFSGRWPLDGHKTLFNVGSVGQPRDNDPNASLVVVYDNYVQFYKVPYAVETTVQKMRVVPALHHSLAERLRLGR